MQNNKQVIKLMQKEIIANDKLIAKIKRANKQNRREIQELLRKKER